MVFAEVNSWQTNYVGEHTHSLAHSPAYRPVGAVKTAAALESLTGVHCASAAKPMQEGEREPSDSQMKSRVSVPYPSLVLLSL